MTHRALLPAVVSLGLLAGCSTKSDPAPAASASTTEASTAASSSAAPSASTPAAEAPGAPVAIPVPAAKVAKELNPKNSPRYTGPTGTLRGIVRIEGDAPPDTTGIKFPPKCAEAAATYGKLFRVGVDKALADAMVAVSGYAGFVPAKGDAVTTSIHGCAFKKRTIAATFGQRIDVQNNDVVDTYMPYLDGAPTRAIMAAIPRGEPVKLLPLEPAHYALRDQLPNPFLVADVYVLKYPTHDVTDLDGRYEIKDIPVGKVQVSAILPVVGKTTGQAFEIKEGDNKLDLTLTFSKADMDPPKPAPSAKPTGAPLGPKG